MIDALHSQLANVVELTPCTCNYSGSWPTFKAEACTGENSKHKLKTCARCVALESFNLRKAAEAALKGEGNG